MKKLFMLLTALSITTMAIANVGDTPTSKTVNVEFTMAETVLIDPSASHIDFGEVAVMKGSVAADTPSVLTVKKGGTEASTIKVTLETDSEILMENKDKTASIKAYSLFDGASGTPEVVGDKARWTESAPGQTTFDVNYTPELRLIGTEKGGDYTGTATIVATYE